MYHCTFLLVLCILACPGCRLAKYCTTRKHIQPYYTLRCLIRYIYSTPTTTFALQRLSTNFSIQIPKSPTYTIQSFLKDKHTHNHTSFRLLPLYTYLTLSPLQIKTSTAPVTKYEWMSSEVSTGRFVSRIISPLPCINKA